MAASRQGGTSLREGSLRLSALVACLLSVIYAAEMKQTKPGGKQEMANEVKFELLTPETIFKPTGYSQMAMVHGGTIVFIAGQVAVDKSGSVVGKGDFRAQVQQVFENLKAAVEAAGGTFNDVIKLNSYLVDLSHVAEFREVRDKYINLKNPPASTAVQVGGLFRPEFQVEIEAIAVISK
jgi:2-iminobutanoate/2-iminopropanoate deaminase